MYTARSRVRVTNQSTIWYKKLGTVKSIDDAGRLWVRIDGHPPHQCLPFYPGDLSDLAVSASPLIYSDEPTTHPYRKKKDGT